jgi:hypothetical protein
MITSALHFVGFTDDAYTRAVRVFGEPHFIHRYWDKRAVDDVAPCDVVVFARTIDWLRYESGEVAPYAFNDSEFF